MSPQTLRKLVLVFAALVLAVFVPSLVRSILPQDTRASNDLELNRVRQDAVQEIVMKKTDGTETKLVKKDAKWHVGDYDASQKLVDDFFRSLDEIKVSELIGTNPENHAAFEIDDAKATLVTFKNKDGKESAVLMIGKGATDFSSWYLRRKGSNNVYKVTGGFRFIAQRASDDWRDKEIASIERDKIESIEVAPSDQTKRFTVSRKDDKWQVTDAKGKTAEFKDALAGPFFEALEPLAASGFRNDAGDSKKFAQAKNKAHIKITLRGDEKQFELELLKQQTEWWLKRADRETIYTAHDFQISNLIPDPKKLFE